MGKFSAPQLPRLFKSCRAFDCAVVDAKHLGKLGAGNSRCSESAGSSLSDREEVVGKDWLIYEQRFPKQLQLSPILGRLDPFPTHSQHLTNPKATSQMSRLLAGKVVQARSEAVRYGQPQHFYQLVKVHSFFRTTNQHLRIRFCKSYANHVAYFGNARHLSLYSNQNQIPLRASCFLLVLHSTVRNTHCCATGLVSRNREIDRRSTESKGRYYANARGKCGPGIPPNHTVALTGRHTRAHSAPELCHKAPIQKIEKNQTHIAPPLKFGGHSAMWFEHKEVAHG